MTRDDVQTLWARACRERATAGETIEHFAALIEALVAQAEREACAKVCFEIQNEYLEDTEGDDFAWDAAKQCEDAIRARAVDQP